MARSFLFLLTALFFFTFSNANLHRRGSETANTRRYPLQNAQQQQQQQLPLVDTEAVVQAQATQVAQVLEAHYQAHLVRMEMHRNFCIIVIFLCFVYKTFFVFSQEE